MDALQEQVQVVKDHYYNVYMRSLIKYFILLIFAFAISWNNSIIFSQEIDKDFQKMIERKYDAFPTIQPEDAEAKIGKEVYFLDTRETVEFEVSHLPNAIHVGYDNLNWKKINTLDKKAEIIVYCSIGVRSQDIGKKLKEKGFKNVKNLYGGIFLWADQAREMEDQNQKSTNSVHGYNKYWGRWVKKAEVVYE